MYWLTSPFQCTYLIRIDYPIIIHCLIMREFTGAQWLTENNVSSNIYADVYGKFIFYRFTPNMNNISANNGISEFTNYTKPNTYMYLQKIEY